MVTRGPNYVRDPPPYGLVICKGIKNVVVNRNTLEFFLYDDIAIELYNWLSDVEVPEENYYSTLIRVNVGSDGQGESLALA